MSDISPSNVMSQRGVGHSDSRQIAVKRTWTEMLNVPLLREVLAVGAHIPARGETMPKFAEIAHNLNNNTHINLAWKTDAKHCRDRFKLLMEKFVSNDYANDRASGGGEVFEEQEQLLTDMKEAIDDRRQEVEEALRQREGRAEELTNAGEVVRELALDRMDGRVSSGEDGDGPTPKKRRIHGEVDRNMNVALEALQRAEEERTELMVASAAREDRRVELEERRFQREESRAASSQIIEERRVTLEERRVENEEKREKEQAEERQMALQIQSQMLALLATLTKKD